MRLFLLFIVLVTASCSPVTSIKVHTAWPSDNFHTKGLQKFSDLIRDRTNGKLLLEIFSDGKLGFKDEFILDHLQNGNLVLADVLMGNLSTKSEIFGLSSIPRMAGSYSHAYSLYLANKKYYQEELKKYGSKLLYVVPWPPSGIFTKSLIDSGSVVQKLKMRTYDENSAQFIRSIGALGVQIPFNELDTALRAGMIDSVLTSTVTGIESEIWKLMKYFYEINYAFPLDMVIIQEKAFNSLSQDHQEVLLQTSSLMEEELWKMSQKSHEEGLNRLKAEGINIQTDLPKFFGDLLDSSSKRIRDAWILRAKNTSFSLDIYRESD